MRIRMPILATIAVLVLGAAPADAWHAVGCVKCNTNQNGQLDDGYLPLKDVGVRVHNAGGTFTNEALTDANGQFSIPLLDVPDLYLQTLDPTTLPPGASIVFPGGGTATLTTTETIEVVSQDWLVQSPACQNLACWLTGGGVKFEPVVGANLAEKGPHITFGGNVHPGCSATAGDGGSWNHIDHKAKLHFHGIVIPTVRCGNVSGIPAGSTSPVTPFNFIEFEGTGTLKGIAGNKANYGTIYFRARAEDRNEPGSSGAKAGALVDRYFLHVYANQANPAGSTLYLFDGDGDPATVDPVIITGGNLQIHISSCDNPPLGF
jgi:hypothetical protein